MERGGMKKKKKSGKKEREMGGEQRNWKMRVGLEKGQGEKKRKRREREGGRVHVFC